VSQTGRVLRHFLNLGLNADEDGARVLDGVLAIIASGLVVTYTTTGIFNIAHGATGMLAAFAYWQFTVKFGWPVWLSVVLVLFVLLVNIVFERPLGAAHNFQFAVVDLDS
jgi:branched-subunit amino acid ABC-type transport system permease component